MATKRIRCICGKIYDSTSQPVCPDCKTPAPTSSKITVTNTSDPMLEEFSPKSNQKIPPPPEVPPELRVMLDSDRKKRPWLYVQPPKKLVLYASLLAFLMGGWFILRPRPKPIPPQLKIAEQKVAPTEPTPTSENVGPISPSDLATEIAKAKPGATIRLAAGTYHGGFHIEKAIHLIGDSTNGPVIIESEEKGALEIKASGVILENLHFTGAPGGDFANLKILDAATLDLRQCMIDTAGKFGVGGVGNAKISATQTTFSSGDQGTGFRLEGSARAELTDCVFTHNRFGCSLWTASQCRLLRCRFEQNGLPDQFGYSAGGKGDKTYLEAEQCTFTDNVRGVSSTEGSHINLKACTFKNNGIQNAPANKWYGTVNADKGGQLLIKDCTFDSNREGVAIETGATAKIENCTFTNNGLEGIESSAIFYSCSISAGNEGTHMTLHKTNIRQSKQDGINLVQGAYLEMEDCEVSGGLRNGLAVGAGDDLHGEATVVNCRFLENKLHGISIASDSAVKISKSSISRNGLEGIYLAGGKSTVVAEECEVNQNGECGILSIRGAFSVLSRCTLSGNLYGAQNGLTDSKDKSGSGLFLEKSTISNSTEFGLGAFDGSSHISDCTFTNNKKNFYRAGGLIITEATGGKPLPTDEKTGVEPTGQTGGMTGMESSPESQPEPTNLEADKNNSSRQQKKRPSSPKRTPAPRNKADEILRNVLRFIPR